MKLKGSVILPCLALGSSLFIMQASESVISVCFNTSLLKYGGDVAVGAMTILTSVMQFAMLPLAGNRSGSTADHELQLRSRRSDKGEKDVSPVVESGYVLRSRSVGVDHVVPSGVCSGIYSGSGVDRIYKTGTSDLYSGVIPVWNSDVLSDGI